MNILSVKKSNRNKCVCCSKIVDIGREVLYYNSSVHSRSRHDNCICFTCASVMADDIDEAIQKLQESRNEG